MALTGNTYEKDGKWRFTFTATHACTGECLGAARTFRSKSAYLSEAEAEAALKRSAAHYAERVLAEADARYVEQQDFGQIPIDIDYDSAFAGAPPEVH